MYNINSSKIIMKTLKSGGMIERIYSDGRRDLVSLGKEGGVIEIEKLSKEEIENLKEEIQRINSKTGSDLDLF